MDGESGDEMEDELWSVIASGGRLVSGWLSVPGSEQGCIAKRMISDF